MTLKRLKAVTRGVREILPPVELQARMAALPLERAVIGHSGAGAALTTYRFGAGRRQVLLYGFPDPGEAVGGTVILTLAEAWCRGALDLDATWHCLPVANPDDQPDGGRTLQPVRKTAAQEIGWWTDAPRPEAEALLRWADAVQPAFTFPLHDEFHDGVLRPAYFPVSHRLPASVTAPIVELFGTLGHPISAKYFDAQMGEGFVLMEALAGDDWARCTFRQLAAHGPVVIAEVGAGLPARTLVQAQLGAILTVVDGPRR